MLKRFKNILWDFDGVILDSMPTRDKGFEIVLGNFPIDQVEQLMVYHRSNGGLSRYVKFRHFFEVIRNEEVTDQDILKLADKFSTVMRSELVDFGLLINDTLQFLHTNHENYQMHIVSGSDQKELRYLCQQLDIDQYFQTISGSPTPKTELVATIMQSEDYDQSQTVLIGDSRNDFDAAEANGISFLGYNQTTLRGKGVGYIEAFSDL